MADFEIQPADLYAHPNPVLTEQCHVNDMYVRKRGKTFVSLCDRVQQTYLNLMQQVWFVLNHVYSSICQHLMYVSMLNSPK